MGSMSDFLELKVLDHLLGVTGALAPSASSWLALYWVPPSDAGGGTECWTASGYARVAVQANNATNWPAATTGAKWNGAAFEFPTATYDWGNISAFGIFDAVSAGNLLYWSNLATVKNVASGDVARFASASITITLD